MPHIPLVVYGFRASATGGFAGAVIDFLAQLVEKKVVKKVVKDVKEGEEEEEGGEGAGGEPISAVRLVKAFGLGVVAGNIGGTSMYGRSIHAKWHHILGACGWTELAWLPLHANLCLGKGELIEDNIPMLFGYSVFATAGAVVWCDVLIHFRAMNPTSLRYIGHVKDALEGIGCCTIGAVLFIFSNKFADCQRNKTIVDKSATVEGIHWFAVTVGQGLGNLVAFSLVMTPWLKHMPVFWFPAMLLTPSFMLCTSLNIENGVRSVEINGRTDPTPARRAEAQKRISIMQVLPLGALPSGFMKGHTKHAAAIMLGKFLAAMCASTYIAYQQQPWGKYMRKEKGEYRQLKREEGQEWGAEWEWDEEDGALRLKSIADGSPFAAIEDLLGRRLALCNDDKMTSVEAWAATAEGGDPPPLIVNLDFERKLAPKKSWMEQLDEMKASAGMGGGGDAPATEPAEGETAAPAAEAEAPASPAGAASSGE